MASVYTPLHFKTYARLVISVLLFEVCSCSCCKLIAPVVVWIIRMPLNFMSNEVRIVRKGGNQDVLVFGSEVREALLNYMLRRESMTAQPGHEKALFLSMQNKRMTVRAIENLVKKYAALAAPLKRISPHKLRSTYGTMLYRESGDIYLVADVLGQKDVNTTRKHYVPQAEDRRRFAAEVISLKGKKSGTADADTKNGNEPDETE